MNTLEIKELLIANGGKFWEKGTMARVYINSDIVAKAFGFSVVSTPSMKNELSSFSDKSKVYFDVTKGWFVSHTGALNTFFNQNELKSVRA